ncbi:MAG: NADH:flavin oxidoreductase [Planctomycetes bacterium]|nr:NADH:flavin oxidoreductase [Planctomycetota bacterium]
MPTLDQSLTLPCGARLPHRFALAPLTNLQSNQDGSLHQDELRWLERRAGHFGLVSTCAASVSEDGRAWPGQLGIHHDGLIPGLERLATALRRTGSVAIVQIHHGGDKAERSASKISTVDREGVRGASEADLERVVGDFVAAARRAERAGFDGVELHGANGYLFTQFLAPEDNPRTDAYGGDRAGRARLLREALRAVRAATAPGFAVGVRLSPVDVWSQRGLVLADGVQVARWMAEDGADFVHLSLKDAAGPAPFEDTGVVVARAVRDALPPEVPVISAGGVWTRADAARAAAAGADIVAIGKAAIVHPDWPEASRAAGFAPLRPPWDPDHLRRVDVGPDFVDYLMRFPGLVAGGAVARA